MTEPADQTEASAPPADEVPPRAVDGNGAADGFGATPAGAAPADDALPASDQPVTAKRGKPSMNRTIVEWVVLVAAALLIAIVVKTFLFQAFYIPSESMVPTLKVGDRVLVNKVSYRLHDPKRGDIVVFKAPEGAASADIKDLVKRIVGLPGERIEGRDGKIYINGRELSEPYLPAGIQSRTFGPEVVPANSYFMLGDNRPFSKDSTFFGPVARSALIGRVFLRIWPPRSIGFL